MKLINSTWTNQNLNIWVWIEGGIPVVWNQNNDNIALNWNIICSICKSSNSWYLSISEIDSWNNISNLIPTNLITWTNWTHSYFIFLNETYNTNWKVRIVWTQWISWTWLVTKVIEIDLSNYINNSIVFSEWPQVLVDATADNYNSHISKKVWDTWNDKYLVTYNSSTWSIIAQPIIVIWNTTPTLLNWEITWSFKANSDDFKFIWKWKNWNAENDKIVWIYRNSWVWWNRILTWIYNTWLDTYEQVQDKVLENSTLASINLTQNNSDIQFVNDNLYTDSRILYVVNQYLTVIDFSLENYFESSPITYSTLSWYLPTLKMLDTTNWILINTLQSEWMTSNLINQYFYEISWNSITLWTAFTFSSNFTTLHYKKSSDFLKIDWNKYCFICFSYSYLSKAICEVSEWAYYTNETIDTDKVINLAIPATKLKVTKVSTIPAWTYLYIEYELNQDWIWNQVTTFDSFFNVPSFSKIRFRIRKKAISSATPFLDDIQVWVKE